jgi:hypothetical protein
MSDDLQYLAWNWNARSIEDHTLCGLKKYHITCKKGPVIEYIEAKSMCLFKTVRPNPRIRLINH